MEVDSANVISAVFIAYIVVKEVFVLVKGETKEVSKKVSLLHSFFTSQKNGWLSISDKISDLWEWHNKEDVDGVKIWYMRSSLISSLQDFANAVNELTNVNKAFVSRTHLIERDIDKVESVVKELSKDIGLLSEEFKKLKECVENFNRS